MAAIQIAGAAVATYLVVAQERHQSYVAFDAKLGEQAAVLRSLIDAPEERNQAIEFHKEFLAVSKSDRFLITDAKGEVIGSSDEAPTIRHLPQEPRSVVDLRMGDTAYRALILQKVTVVDPETAPTPASPAITLIFAAPVSPVEAHIWRVASQAVEACLTLLVAVTAVSAWALTRSLQPLRDLASDAEKIDVDHWALPELEESRRYSELRPLAEAIEGLISRLRGAFDRERQFFGDAAHEMKSSVAIVRSTLQFALQTDRSAGEYKEELQGAFADTARLQDLVASMLNLARIESNTRFPTQTTDSLTEVHAEIRRVIMRLRPLAIPKRIQIDIEATQREVWVGISGNDLLTILSNLVENAIQYSDLGKHILIGVGSDSGRCEISVSDAGCGIAPSALPYIFDRFYRGDASRARATGGFGLGLSIAKALVLRANGTISVQSEQGGGSTFSIVLPIPGPNSMPQSLA